MNIVVSIMYSIHITFKDIPNEHNNYSSLYKLSLKNGND